MRTKILFQKEHISIINKALAAFNFAIDKKFGLSLFVVFDKPSNSHISQAICEAFYRNEIALKKIEVNSANFEYSDEELIFINCALEYFMRCRSMQFSYAFEQAFPKQLISYEDAALFQNLLRKVFAPNLSKDSYYGIYTQDVGVDATIAYEIYRTIEQFLALKESGGWITYSREFDDPMANSELPLPRIIGHEELKYKKFLFNEQDSEKASEILKSKDFDYLWNFIHEKLNPPFYSRATILVDNDQVLGVSCYKCKIKK